MYDLTSPVSNCEMKTYEKDTPYAALEHYIHSFENKECIVSTPELEEEIAYLLLDIRDKPIPVSKTYSDTDSYEASLKRRKVGPLEEDSDIDYKDEVLVRGEEEEYWLEEEEDDDWMEARGYLNTTPLPSQKVPRKKAPSGTACEKHKRWKKRCPEDCPMRKQKSKKSVSPTLSRRVRYSEDSNSDQESIAEDRSMYMEKRKRTAETAIMDESDKHIILIGPASAKRRNGGRRPAGATIACERHTLMHARCPPNCVERRPSSAPRVRKSREESDDSDFESISDLSPVSSTSFDEFDDDNKEITTKELAEQKLFSRLTQLSDDLPKSPRIQMKAMAAGETKFESKKTVSPKTQRNKGTRKYLPAACERHKLLHAKCPANCPDRLSRDSGKTMMEIPTQKYTMEDATPQQIISLTLVAQQ